MIHQLSLLKGRCPRHCSQHHTMYAVHNTYLVLNILHLLHSLYNICSPIRAYKHRRSEVTVVIGWNTYSPFVNLPAEEWDDARPCMAAGSVVNAYTYINYLPWFLCRIQVSGRESLQKGCKKYEYKLILKQYFKD